MYDILLLAHGAFGALALLGAAGSIVSRLLAWAHRRHVVFGNFFMVGMLGVALTGLAITLVNPSLFLLSLALFILYLVVMGWRYAKARQGMQSALDKILAFAFFGMFGWMTSYGALVVMAGDGIGWVLVVFGAIGMLQSIGDIMGAFGKPVTGKARIAAHLSRMMGGTIAVLTAFLLVQFQSNSLFFWLGPTLAITPLIFFWGRKVRGGWLPKSPLRDNS